MVSVYYLTPSKNIQQKDGSPEGFVLVEANMNVTPQSRFSTAQMTNESGDNVKIQLTFEENVYVRTESDREKVHIEIDRMAGTLSATGPASDIRNFLEEMNIIGEDSDGTVNFQFRMEGPSLTHALTTSLRYDESSGQFYSAVSNVYSRSSSFVLGKMQSRDDDDSDLIDTTAVLKNLLSSEIEPFTLGNLLELVIEFNRPDRLLIDSFASPNNPNNDDSDSDPVVDDGDDTDVEEDNDDEQQEETNNGSSGSGGSTPPPPSGPDTSGDDTFTLTSGDDNFDGDAGNDTFSGDLDDLSANDWIMGGDDDDLLELTSGGTGTLGDNTSGIETISMADGESYDLTLTADANADADLEIDASALTGTNSLDLTVDSGFEGNISVTSGAGADSITTGAGDDTITTGAGQDTIVSGAGNDTIYSGAGTDSIDAGAGNDRIVEFVGGSGGSDTILAGDGDDFVNGGWDHDRIYGGAGNDTLIGGNHNDLVSGGDGNDSIRAHTAHAAGEDTLLGDAGDDTLEGGDGNDLLDGGTGNDLLTGAGASNTFVIGDGEGNDTITDFTQGSDVIDLTSFTNFAADGVTWADIQGSVSGGDLVISLGGGQTLTLQGLAGTTLTGEDFLFTAQGTPSGSGDFLVDSNVAGNTIDALTGDDTILGQGGDDSLDGGRDDDLIYAGAGDDTITDDSSGAGGNDTVYAGRGNDSINTFGGEDSIYLGTGSDTVNAGDGADSIDGTEDDVADSILGGDQNDTIQAGGGNDTIRAGEDDDLVYANDGDDVIIDVNNGAGGNDTVYAGAGNDSVLTYGGDDSIYLGTGSDTVNAGDGADSIDATADNVADDIMAGDGDDTIQAGGGNDTIHGGEDDDLIYGNDGDDSINESNNALGGNDTIYGGAGNDTILSQTGDDVLSGGAGNDFLYGGTGNDTYVIEDAADVDTIQGFTQGEDIIDISGATDSLGNPYSWADIQAATTTDASNTTIALDGETIVLNGFTGTLDVEDFIYAAQGTPSNGADFLAGGNNTDDSIHSQDGSDLVLGQGGNDTILVGGNGNNTVYGGAGDDSISGAYHADSLLGGSGDDTLVAFSANGVDTLVGGTGADLFKIYQLAGTDTHILDFDRSEGDKITPIGGYDGIYAEGTSTEPGHLEYRFVGADTEVFDPHGSYRFTIVGQNIALTDSDFIFGDQIGTAGDDSLVSTGDNDIILGGDGNDTLIGINDSGESINGGAGDDSINGGHGVEKLFGGAGNDTINGGSQGATIFGGSGDDSIIDGDGGSTIDGGAGNDTFLMQSGNDRATGGTGNDMFVMQNNSGVDTITDFTQGEDIIDISAATDSLGNPYSWFDIQAGLTQDSLGSTIALDGETIVLEGFTGTLDVEDFLYEPQGAATAGVDFIAGDNTAGDSIDAANGNDVVVGQGGDDTIEGGAGSDTLRGGAGDDLFIYDAGNGSIWYQDDISGGSGTDTLMAASTTTAYVSSISGIEVIDTDGFDLTITGANGSDSLDLSDVTLVSGNVILDGGNNNDTIIGTQVDDVIAGGGESDSLDGGAGNDTFIYDNANGSVWYSDTVIGGAGTDVIQALASDIAYIDHIEGVEEIDANGFDLTISGGNGNDSLDLSDVTLVSGNVTIDGGNNNDTIIGTQVDDVIAGGGEADSLDGGAGNDTFIYDSANGSIWYADTVIGGAGTDVVLATETGIAYIEHMEGVEEIDANGFNLTISSGNGNDLLDLSDVTLVSGNVTIDGGGNNDTIIGSQDDDVIDGGTSIDSLDGGAGNDTFIYDNSNGGIWEADTVIGGAGTDVVLATETGIAYIEHMEGVEEIDANGFDLTISSANGNDLLDLSDVTLVSGNVTIDGGGNNDTILGTQDDDYIHDSNGDDVITGNAGNDTIVIDNNVGTKTITDFTQGEDIIDISQVLDGGSSSYDWAGIQAVTAQDSLGTTISMAGETIILDGFTGTLTVYDFIHAAQGAATAGDDLIIGDNEAGDSIEALTGNDTVLGQGGDDTFVVNGDDGLDIYLGGAGNDMILGGAGDDTIGLRNGFGASNSIETIDGGLGTNELFLQGSSSYDFSNVTFENIQLITGNIVGGSNDNITISSGASDDSIVIEGDWNLERAIVSSGDGNDTISAGVGYSTIDGGAGDDLFFASGNWGEYTGGTGDDTLMGTAGDDTIRFGGGLDGSNSLETIDGGLGTNILSLRGNFQSYDLTTTTLLNIDGINLFLNSGGHDAITLTSGAADDAITIEGGWVNDQAVIDAGDGNNTITGGIGFETITAGTGDDLILVSGDSNFGVYNLGAGDDTLMGSAGDDTIGLGGGFSSSNSVETIDGGAGTNVLELRGNAQNYDLTATTLQNIDEIRLFLVSSGHDNITVTGTAGDDNIVVDGGYTGDMAIIDAGAGNDTITGGIGLETVTGGAGDDRFVVIDSTFTITDFTQGEDMVDISQATDSLGGVYSWADIAAATTADSSNTTIALDGESIILEGFTGTLNLNDFILAAQGTPSTGANFVVGEDTAADSIDGLGGNDTISGQGGDDTIIGNTGTDQMYGGAGDDLFLVAGDDGYDFYYGGQGSDTIQGSGGDDTIAIAISGNGTFSLANNGIEFIDGGAGTDYLYLQASAGAYGNNKNYDFRGIDLSGIEEIRVNDADYTNSTYVYTDSADDSINSYNNGGELVAISSGDGNDTITLRGGRDSITAGDGDDLINILGYSSRDYLDGGAGDDTVVATAGDDTIGIDIAGGNTFSLINNSIETIDGGLGTNYIYLSGSSGSGTGSKTYDFSGYTHGVNLLNISRFVITDGDYNNTNTVITTAGDDYIVSQNNSIELYTFQSGDGDDTIIASTANGREVIDGGAGNDLIFGGGGANMLTGGTGNDTFEYRDNTNDDTITDFTVGEDQLDVSKILVTSYAQPLDWAYISANMTDNGTNTTITFDGSQSIILNNVVVGDLSASDFIFDNYDAVPTTGNDFLVGEDSVGDTIDALAGNDVVFGLDGDDSLVGNAGNDTLFGGAGNDYLHGGDNNDRLDGGAGNDTLVDTINSGTSQDTLYGGDGNDLFVVSDSTDTNVVDGGSGDDTIQFTANNTSYALTSISGIEEIDANGFTGITLLGTSTADVSLDLSGTTITGDVVISMSNGHDTLIGTTGNDTIYDTDSNGIDSLHGNDGDDLFILRGATVRNTVDGGLGDDTIQFSQNNMVYYFGLLDGIEHFDADGHTGVTISASGVTHNLLDFSGATFDGEFYIDGRGGNNTIIGNGDDNTIRGGSGNDTITGGAGNDTFVLLDGSGADRITDFTQGEDKLDISTALNGAVDYTWANIQAGLAQDSLGTTISMTGETIVLEGFTGTITVDDFIFAVQGTDAGGSQFLAYSNVAGDSITATTGGDTIVTQGGNDTVHASSDTVYLGDGDDFVPVLGYSNVVYGGAGNDLVLPGSTNQSDTVYGGSGNDTIMAGAGADRIVGDEGDDSLFGNAGNDSMTGGADNDIFIAVVGDGNDTITDFTVGEDVINVAFIVDSNHDEVDWTSLQTMMSDDGTDTTITYDGGTIVLQGVVVGDLSASDFTFAADMQTTLTDTAIDDIVIGEDSLGENIPGVTSYDTIHARGGDDTILAQHDLVFLGDGNDVVTALSWSNTIYGGLGDDSISAGGSSQADTIYGGSGDDTVLSGTGADLVYGDSGEDVINASGGNDTISGGAGNDSITGGNGSDLFRFDETADGGTGSGNRDTITDFAQGSDVIHLTAETPTILIGNAAFNGVAGEVRYTFPDGSSTLLQVDIDGDSTADFEIEFTNGNIVFDYSDFYSQNYTLTSGNDNFTGNFGEDTITVDSTNISVNDTIEGGMGYDTLTVTNGGITLDNTVYTNLAGIETFSFDANGAHHVIIDDSYFNTAGFMGNVLTITENVGGGSSVDASALSSAYAINLTIRGASTVTGGAGNDTITLTFRNSTIDGGAGDDSITGHSDGNSAERLIGGLGADTITGNGGGIHTFVFDPATDSGVGGGNRDVITDFDQSEDIIEFTNVASGSITFIGETAFTGGGNPDQEMRYEKAGGITVLQIDMDGDGAADFEIEFSDEEFDLNISNFTDAVDGSALGEYLLTSSSDNYVAGAVDNLFAGDASNFTAADTISGGAGNDTIEITTGTLNLDTDVYTNVSGVEHFVFNQGGSHVLTISDDYFARGGFDGNVLYISNGVSNSGPDVDASGVGSSYHLNIETGASVNVIGGAGNDTISLTFRNATIDGGAGDDLITGSNDGNSTEYYTGGLGADTISGNNGGLQTFYFNETTDSGIGSGNRDVLTDYRVTDVLEFTGGTDLIYVGDGSFTNRAGEMRYEYPDGSSTLLQIDNDGDGVADFEIEFTNGNITFDASNLVASGGGSLSYDLIGGSGDDTIVGSNNDDTLDGGAGNDTLDGSAGDDSLVGSADNDTISGAAGSDTIEGGAGNDSLIGDSDVYGAVFDGNTDRINVSDPGAGSEFDFDNGESLTLAANINTTAFVNYQTIINKGRTSGSSDGNYILRVGNGSSSQQKLCFYFRESDNSGWHVFTSDADVISLNTWQHVAVSYTFGDGSSIQLYVDGVAVAGSWALGDGDASAVINDVDLVIGALDSGQESFNGTISDVRIYSDIISGTDIQSLSDGVEIDDTNLEGQWNLDDGSGSTAVDSSSNGNNGTLSGDTYFTGDAGGNDSIDGGAGNDTIDGGAGNDHLLGSTEDDFISGGEGNDTIEDGAGDDQVFAGLGDDSIILGDGDDYISGGDGGDTITSIADNLDANDTISGGDGTDTMIFTAAGNMTIGDNVTGIESFVLDSMGDYFVTISANANADEDIVINASTAFNGIEVTTDAGFTGDMTITSASASDVITTDSGNDYISSGNSGDTINAGAGNDTLFGGQGGDRFTGGDGDDVFIYTNVNQSGSANPDLITDFVIGEDLIDLSGIAEIVDINDLIITQDSIGGTTTIVDNDTLDFSIELTGLHSLTATDFAF